MSVFSHIIVIAVITVASVGLGYLLGWRRCRQAHSGLYLIYSIPRDDVDIDIPRPQDNRRYPC